jgi:hypothetical protein
MIGLLCFVLAVLASPFKSKLRLEAEHAVLRHQLIVLRRRLHGRVRFTNHDRWFFYPAVSLVSIDLEVLTVIHRRRAVRRATPAAPQRSLPGVVPMDHATDGGGSNPHSSRYWSEGFAGGVLDRAQPVLLNRTRD